jgi:pimeloyl-ACP methyl ester carboxylesterase
VPSAERASGSRRPKGRSTPVMRCRKADSHDCIRVGRPSYLSPATLSSMTHTATAAKALGANVAVIMRNAATNVQELVVPNAGHWLMEEAPAATIAAVQDFLAAH